MDKAQRIASKQKQISISEFFEKNKHFLDLIHIKERLLQL